MILSLSLSLSLSLPSQTGQGQRHSRQRGDSTRSDHARAVVTVSSWREKRFPGPILTGLRPLWAPRPALRRPKRRRLRPVHWKAAAAGTMNTFREKFPSGRPLKEGERVERRRRRRDPRRRRRSRSQFSKRGISAFGGGRQSKNGADVECGTANERKDKAGIAGAN